MPARTERHSGLQRGQTLPAAPRTTQHPTVGAWETDNLKKPSPKKGVAPLTNGCKLRSGITVTFPAEGTFNEEREPSQEDLERDAVEASPSSSTPWRSDTVHRDSPNSHRHRRHLSDQHGKQQGSYTDRSHYRGRRSRSHSKITDTAEARLSEQMKLLQVEKGMAEEQARQAERQAQDLMEERARIKAEKEQLERSHNEMAARVEILEGIINETEALAGDEESISCPSEGPERISSPEVKSKA